MQDRVFYTDADTTRMLPLEVRTDWEYAAVLETILRKYAAQNAPHASFALDLANSISEEISYSR